MSRYNLNGQAMRATRSYWRAVQAAGNADAVLASLEEGLFDCHV